MVKSLIPTFTVTGKKRVTQAQKLAVYFAWVKTQQTHVAVMQAGTPAALNAASALHHAAVYAYGALTVGLTVNPTVYK